MEPFFIHPWYMAAGGALISSPILIHLINRMRFKRIRWAAMEFLLKSQKRNRRRLIIEQMILLLLRILLVLLAAFLVARFLYAGVGAKSVSHVVVLDDTLSMADRAKEGGRTGTAYEVAVGQIRDLVRSASQASSAQTLRVYLLSEMDGPPVWEGRLSDRTIEEIDGRLIARRRKPSFLHASPLPALVKGHAFLAEGRTDGKRILHIISDFRDRDWTAGADSEKMQDEIKKILENNININLVDVAHPARSGSGRVALHHDNLALVDLRAESRVAIEDTDIEFTAGIMNFGTGEGRCRVQVFINGQEDLGRAQPLDRLPAGRLTEHKFTLRFPRKARPGLEITEKDRPDERERKRRLQRQFFQVRVQIGNEDNGLNADNVRDLVIEVRNKIPTLVVDGNKPEARGDFGDMHHLQSFIAASGIYEIEERRLAELETADLDLYPSIIMLNVAEIENAKLRDKLKKYVETGGSLCWFLGEEIKPEHYNTDLFKAGLFPLKIGDRPFDPLAASYPDPDARKKERDRLRTQDPQPKILFRKPDHPLVSRLAPFRSVFRYLGVGVYWQAQPRGQWDPEPRKAEELIVLPNTGGLDKYRNEAMRLAGEAVKATDDLAKRETEYRRFVKPVESARIKIRNALSRSDLFSLAEALEGLLMDPGIKDDPEKPKMGELWVHVSMKQLESQIREFRETVLFGDPLVVSKRQGKGRLVAMLTTAGTLPRRGVSGEDQVQWNNWGSGEQLVSQTYPLFLLDMQRYLVSEGQAPNRVVGENVELTFDATRYAPQVSWTFTPQPDLEVLAPRIEEEKDKGVMDKVGTALNFQYKKATRPGVYRFEFTLLGDGPEDDRREVRAFAYNVDATQESDLKRAARDRLDPTIPGEASQRGTLTVRVPGESITDYKETQPDASESPWLYLFFIIILVVEQAMAVHLSFHLKGSEAGAPAAAPSRAA